VVEVVAVASLIDTSMFLLQLQLQSRSAMVARAATLEAPVRGKVSLVIIQRLVRY
jgi:hypothetical protein